MNKKRNWAIAVLLAAAAGVFALQNVSAPSSPTSITETPALSFPEEISSPTPTYEACGFMWAYHDDPELSTKINEVVQAIDSSANARVQLFGEDCVYADGHSTFSVMETDFYLQLSADDQVTEEQMGSWMKEGLELVIALPEDEVQGRKGFVEFSFFRNETEQTIIRVMIQDYLNNGKGSSGAELFKQFYTPVPTPIASIPSTPTP